MKLIFSKRNGNIISWLIRKYIKCDYSHTAIVIELYGINLVLESSFEGVNVVTLDKFLEKNTVIKEIKLQQSTYTDSVISYIFKNIDKGFSFSAFIGIIFKKKTIGDDGEKYMICSELVARAFGMSGDLDHITPLDVELFFSREHVE